MKNSFVPYRPLAPMAQGMGEVNKVTEVLPRTLGGCRPQF
jgi:hypothetical protein